MAVGFGVGVAVGTGVLVGVGTGVLVAGGVGVGREAFSSLTLASIVASIARS